MKIKEGKVTICSARVYMRLLGLLSTFKLTCLVNPKFRWNNQMHRDITSLNCIRP